MDTFKITDDFFNTLKNKLPAPKSPERFLVSIEVKEEKKDYDLNRIEMFVFMKFMFEFSKLRSEPFLIHMLIEDLSECQKVRTVNLLDAKMTIQGVPLTANETIH